MSTHSIAAVGALSRDATTPAAATSAAATSAAAAATQSSGVLGTQDFMTLLVAQLQNQNPLDPMDDSTFVTQMAQLSSLQATNSVATQMQGLVASQQTSQALQMVGLQVSYTAADGTAASGVVQSVSLTSNPPTLMISNQQVPLSALQSAN